MGFITTILRQWSMYTKKNDSVRLSFVAVLQCRFFFSEDFLVLVLEDDDMVALRHAMSWREVAVSHLPRPPFRLHSLPMRRVIKSDQGPMEIKPQEKSIWICMCGLSANQPFCDGSHKRTRDEEQGKTYVYDPEGHRTETSG